MILITGASGNVGKEVLKKAAQTGSKVRAAYQSPNRAAVPAGVDVAVVDYNQPETLRRALDGVEKVFLVGPPTRQLVELERKAMDVIVQSKIKHVVKLSAMGRSRCHLSAPARGVRGLHPKHGRAVHLSSTQRLHAEPLEL